MNEQLAERGYSEIQQLDSGRELIRRSNGEPLRSVPGQVPRFLHIEIDDAGFGAKPELFQ